MAEKKCFLCGKNGVSDPIETHHIFGNAYRNKSEKYGLVVYLCGSECHRNGPNAVHVNPATRYYIRRYGQRKAMEENGWDTSDFIREFGRNYL